MISNVEVPPSEPKIVVTGFLSPDDDTIKIIVRKSRALYVQSQGWENQFPIVNNATVTLSDGASSVILPFDSQSACYKILSSSMPVIPGKTYFLEVTTPEGHKATSSCVVPERIGNGIVSEIEITSIDTINQYGSAMKVSFRFRDIPGNGNFYRISAGAFINYEYFTEPYFQEIGFERGENFVTDKNKEDNYFNFRTHEIYLYDSENIALYISLMLTDENYYNYHKSIYSFEGDNPFSEPTPVFTNINGGLGVFGAVNWRIDAVFAL
jgi:hypothetical protein